MVDASKLRRAQLFPLLTDAAVKVVRRYGREAKVDNCPGHVLDATRGEIVVMFATPESRAPGMASNYIVDVHFRRKKVLSVGWDSHVIKDYVLIAWHRGPWIPELLAMASQFDNTNADGWPQPGQLPQRLL